MDLETSKHFKETDAREEGEENKIQDDIQKLKKKNERQEAQSNQSEDEKKRHEKKLHTADQETSKTNKKTEKLVQSSARFTETEPDQGRNENDKMDSHCDEAGSKDGILKGTYFFEFDVLHLLYMNFFFKCLIDDIEHVRVSAYWYPINRPVYEHVYAVSFNEGPMPIDTFGNKQMIKYILIMQNLRERYLADEHFRLATFSLHELNYEKGEMLRLAGSGYFCDIDGRVKCFCCGNTYSPDFIVTHHPCTSRYSNRSIADNYGTSAANWLVPSRQNEEEEHRGREFIDIHLRITTTSIRLGRTQQIVQDDTVTQDIEEGDNTDFISVRGSVNSTDESSHGANIDVSLQEHCEAANKSGHIALPSSDLISIQRQQDPLKENQRRCSVSEGREASHRSAGHPGMCTVDQSKDSSQQATQNHVRGLPSDGQSQNHVRGLPSDGQRTIKEDVNRKKSDGAAARDNLVMENAQFISRTLCCICRKRRRNIVFQPCGHLVVCDQCITNTTECPMCGNKVDTAHPTQDLSR